MLQNGSSVAPSARTAGHEQASLPLDNPPDVVLHALQPVCHLPEEDGPGYRALLCALARKATALKTGIKALLRAAETCLEALSSYQASEALLDGVFLQLAEGSELFGHLQGAYLSKARQANASSRGGALTALEEQVIAPLRQLYAHLKEVDTRRKPFEAESRAYYDATARYLARGDKGDDKHALRTVKFSMARFEYMVILQDAAVFSEARLLAILTQWARLQHTGTIDEARSLSALDAPLDMFTTSYLQIVNGQVQSLHGKVDIKRKDLESTFQSAMAEAGEPYTPGAGFTEALDRVLGPSDADAPFLPLSSIPPTPNDVAIGAADHLKAGILWAGAAADAASKFHKFWVVLSAKHLSDYVGWREEPALHGSPIPLRFATVKESKLSDRRFAFEVITPESRKIYQATSEKEAKSWQLAISSAIERALVDGSPTTPFCPTNVSQRAPHHAAVAPAVLQSGLGVAGSRNTQSLDRKGSFRNGTQRKRDSAAQILHSGLAHLGITPRERQTSNRGGMEIPSLIYPQSKSADDDGRSEHTHPRNDSGGREIDSSGFDHQIALSVKRQMLSSAPATSEKTISTAWIVDVPTRDGHPGIFLCIECAGVHRSLGSHISKVRSVDLDDWTRDQLAAMLRMGNARARLFFGGPAAKEDDIASFIRARYTPLSTEAARHATDIAL